MNRVRIIKLPIRKAEWLAASDEYRAAVWLGISAALQQSTGEVGSVWLDDSHGQELERR